MEKPHALSREVFVILVVGLVSVAAACVSLYPIALSGDVPAYGDNISFWAPNTAFFLDEVHEGRFPLWNPFILCGIPFAADINHGIFYPPNWIVLAAGVAGGLRMLVILHVALGIFGVYLFARSQNIPEPAALFAGLAFGLGEWFLPLSNHIVMLESMSYIGLALYFCARLFASASLRSALSLAVVMALSALAGDVHATCIIALAIAVFAFINGLGLFVRKEARALPRVAALAGAAALMAVLLAAVAVIPAVEMTKGSLRAPADVVYAAAHSLDSRAAVGIIAPNVFGSVSAGTVWNFRAANALYLGIAVICLAVYGVRKPVRALVPAAFVIVGALLSPGYKSVVWLAAHRFVPGFRFFRQPREYFIIAALGVIMLASFGVADLLESKPSQRKKTTAKPPLLFFVFCAVSLVALIVAVSAPYFASLFEKYFVTRVPPGPPAIAWTLLLSAARAVLVMSVSLAVLSLLRSGVVKPVFAACAIVVVILADYSFTSASSIIFGPAALCQGRTSAATALKVAPSSPTDLRIAVNAPGFGEYFQIYQSRILTGVMPAEKGGFNALLRLKSCLVDNEPLYARVPSVLGYSTFLPARYAALHRIATGIDSGSPVRLRPSAAADWRLMSANAVIDASPAWQSCRSRWIESPESARMVYRWSPVNTLDDAVLAVTRDPEAALSTPVIEGAPSWAAMPASSEVLHSVEDLVREPSSVRVKVFTDGPGFLIVADSLFPGWKAYDNGAAVPIFHANIAFRAVYLIPGKHDIEFRYRPVSFYVGLATTCAAMIALVAGFLVRPTGNKE